MRHGSTLLELVVAILTMAILAMIISLAIYRVSAGSRARSPFSIEGNPEISIEGNPEKDRFQIRRASPSRDSFFVIIDTKTKREYLSTSGGIIELRPGSPQDAEESPGRKDGK